MFRVTGEDGVIRLASVKTTVEPLQEKAIRSALKYVINQIKAQAQKTGETRAYVRIDARHSPPTKLNGEEIGRFVLDEVLALIESNVIGKDKRGVCRSYLQ